MENNVLYTESELLPQIIRGNVNAFEQLFTELYTALYFLANRLVVNEELAKDLVADIFLQVWEKRDSLGSVQNIRAFLYTSTRNRSLDYLRKVSHVSQLDHPGSGTEWKELASDNFLQAIYDAETLRALYQAIQVLPAECKKVVELGLEGCSTNEIAEKLGISASAVSNQKSRAIKLLKVKLSFSLLVMLFELLD